jgi:tetratricopeptide (TPR) repeat protein
MFQVQPDSAAAYLFTARLLLRFDFGPVAEEYGKKAIELDPKLPLAHQLLGELYLYQSKIPEASVQFEQELIINPGNPVAYYKPLTLIARSKSMTPKTPPASIWPMPLPPVRTFFLQYSRKRRNAVAICACSAPSWTPTTAFRTTCSARPIAISAKPMTPNAN